MIWRDDGWGPLNPTYTRLRSAIRPGYGETSKRYTERFLPMTVEQRDQQARNHCLILGIDRALYDEDPVRWGTLAESHLASYREQRPPYNHKRKITNQKTGGD